MKYVIVIPDGCADEPVAALGNLTPLQAARVPNMDEVVRMGVVGLSNNVPSSLTPASDVATLSLFGRHPSAAPDAPPPVKVEPRWDRLGSREVKFRGERDAIAVTAAEGRFVAIKLEVDDGDLELYDVVVTFGDGDKFSPATRFAFDQNSRSRSIDLPGGARVIKKVEFFYRSKLARGHANMTLWGLHP